MKHRLLFFVDASSLAHVVRSAFLAQNLDLTKFEVHVATDSQSHHFISNKNIKLHQLSCLPKKEFTKRLKDGTPLFDFKRASQLVEEEIKLIDEVKPDIVIGDFRPTLRISSEKKKIPYVNIINFYWHNLFDIDVAEAPIVRFIGFHISNIIFKVLKYIIYPVLLFVQVIDINRLRKKYNQNTYSNVIDFYTAGEKVIYPDLVEVAKKDYNYTGHFIGPITWFPFNNQATNKLFSSSNDYQKIYLSLGSTGEYGLLPRILRILSQKKVEVVISLAGNKKEELLNIPNNNAIFKFMDFVPGEKASQECDLVISNGGGPSVYQALKYGKPVLGVLTNMDQVLSMFFFEKKGVALSIRDWTFTEKAFEEKLNQIILNKEFTQNAQLLTQKFESYDACKSFETEINNLLNS